MTRNDEFPVGLAVMALTVTLGLFGFLRSPYFQISAIQIQGNAAIDDTTIVAMAQVYVGDNLLDVDVRKLAERIARHPRIRQVSVDRRLPGTLQLNVSEYVPVALVVENGLPTAVTAEGRVVPLSVGEAEQLPRIADVDEQYLPLALAVASHLPPSLRRRVAYVDLRTEGEIDIRLVTRDGAVILFGDEGELARKGAIAASLMEAADYDVVDVRFPRSPAVRER